MENILYLPFSHEINGVHVILSALRGFVKGPPPGKLTSSEDDFSCLV